MGTDVHMFIEQRAADGSWTALRPTDEFSWAKAFERWGVPSERIERLCDDDESTFSWRLDRNYDLFAILANVRNGVGFAGVDTGDGFIPIALPRGLPEDLSPELARCLARGIDHDPGWLTLEEVAEYPHWRTGVTKHRAWTDAFSYRDWVVNRKRTGSPLFASGGVSGPGVRLVDQCELDRVLDEIPDLSDEEQAQLFQHGKKHPLFDGLYTVVEWATTYRESVGQTWWRLFEVIQGFGVHPANLRLVFYFDS